MDTNKEIFEGKSFSGLLKDIYDNSREKEKQIKILIKELQPLIKNIGDATVIVPLIKEYLDVAVKNDAHLIKIASIFQRASSRPGDEQWNLLFTDDEKKQLLSEVEKINDSEEKENGNIKLRVEQLFVV